MELNIFKSLPDSQCYLNWLACESPRHLSKRKEICQWINCLPNHLNQNYLVSFAKCPKYDYQRLQYQTMIKTTSFSLRVGKTITAHLGILTIDRRIVSMPFLLVVVKY